jgi:hypothetical protein
MVGENGSLWQFATPQNGLHGGVMASSSPLPDLTEQRSPNAKAGLTRPMTPAGRMMGQPRGGKPNRGSRMNVNRPGFPGDSGVPRLWRR